MLAPSYQVTYYLAFVLLEKLYVFILLSRSWVSINVHLKNVGVGTASLKIYTM